ncbi:hypothetical protein EIN_095160 [Entamoeba invadens IP1]|uniref:Importin subunit alpha n=2 Tax=Entamoeba invadens TaxID=33085 RepID=A0A0A1U074_ENTIV|nr:hypothetical protein EIN_095160 [Entamoeba invadens IP1]ELP87279.1 hypothetical protein EIN_095160 [Entamoeba invadens IP1]BAN40632.1 hypothetical protein, conserved [Entamoeba invadens]BAN42238.1 hypothetical protein, conserved [Entamoeba invadens]|eukprot:XP_004254050.1 hypothetical protein EIN_095160 [Entamoeba invadens IP1]
MHLRGTKSLAQSCQEFQEDISVLRHSRREALLRRSRPVTFEQEFTPPSSYAQFYKTSTECLLHPTSLLQQQQIIRNLRLSIDNEGYTPLSEIFASGILPTLLQTFSMTHDRTVANEVAWFFINFCEKGGEGTETVLYKLGALAIFSQASKSVTGDAELLVTILWALANMIYFNDDYIKETVSAGVLISIQTGLKQCPYDADLLYVLSAFLRRVDLYDARLVEPFKENIILALTATDEKVVKRALLCCHYLTRYKNTIQYTIKSSLLIRCFQLATSSNKTIRESALIVLKDLSASEEDVVFQMFADNNVFLYLVQLYVESDEKMKKVLAFTFSNLVNTNTLFVERFLETNMIECSIATIFQNENEKTDMSKKSKSDEEILIFLFNCVIAMNAVFMNYVVKSPLFLGIWKFVVWDSMDCKIAALNAASKLLEYFHVSANDIETQNSLVDQFIEIGFDKKCEDLIGDDDVTVEQYANDIVLKYFSFRGEL